MIVNIAIDEVFDHMWSELPEQTVLEALGAQLTAHRKNRGLTQAELAERAGIGVATLVRLENSGQAQVNNLLRVLRALRLLDRVEEALAPPRPSPLAQWEARERK